MPRKRREEDPPRQAAWLITFSDMMTLLLTFFVLLVSMAVFDERRRLIVLGSIIGTFGVANQSYDLRTITPRRTTVEPGPMEMEDVDDLDPLQNLMWEEANKDLNFQSNKFVQILSISDRVLFKPGETELTEDGRKLLDRMLPVFLEIEQPLLLAGHSSLMRDEMKTAYKVEFDKEGLDGSWPLSLYRVLSIYSYLTSRGMPAHLLKVEAFGRFKPKYTSHTAEGRSRNRRVDIVLDKRNTGWIERLKRHKPDAEKSREPFKYKDFEFDLEAPEGPATSEG